MMEEGMSAEVTEDGDMAAEALSLEEQLEAVEAKAAEYLEGWQRARAEFANARKRMDKERANAYRNAKLDIVASLLPAIDDFERATETAPAEVSANSWYEGIQLVYRKLLSLLEKEGIERIETVGRPFDPNFHEAIMQEPSDEYESGNVIRELQSGYRLEERVIRPALVVVAA
jgi:molecular chaperone GrpE